MEKTGDYRYWLEKMRHFKPHTLSESEEKIINIRVDAELKKQDKKLAENDGRSLSNWILRLIQKQIKMSEKASGAKRD